MTSESAAVRRDRFWLWRHLGVGAAALAVMYLFRESRAEWSPMHAWNRALGDASLVLLAVAMSTQTWAFWVTWCRRTKHGLAT